MKTYTTEQFQKDKEDLKNSEHIFLSLGLDMTTEYAKGAIDMLKMISEGEEWEEKEQHYKNKFFNIGIK